jgi:hypothetical protein
MRKISTLVIMILPLTIFMSYGSSFKTFAASSSDSIIGRVTLVGKDTLMIKEDNTQRVYNLEASRSVLDKVSTGYRVEVTTADGKVSSMIILGMPMQAEPQPYQTWTVIKYPDGTTKEVF